MARRKVAVELDLEARGYLDEAGKVLAITSKTNAAIEDLGDEADGSANDLVGLTRVVVIAGQRVDDLGDQASGAGRDMHGLGVDADVAKHQVDDLGDKARTTAADIQLLDARIAATRLSIRELGLEFARTDSAGVGKQLDSERSVLGQLLRLRKELTNDGDNGSLIADLAGSASSVTAAGTQFADNFIGGIGSAFSAAGPYLQTALIAGLIGVIVEMTPLIAGAIGGAVVGVAGLGGIAGGLFAASHDRRVIVAANYFSESISKEFFGSGSSFIQPLLDSLEILRRDFLSLNLGGSFALLAPDVTTIAHGVGDLVKNLMPGLNAAFSRFGPYAAVIADGLADMGTALGGFLDDASRSKGSLQALDTVFMVLNSTITFLGKSIVVLSDIYEDFARSQEALFIALAAGAAALGQTELTQKLLGVARAWSDVGSAAPKAADGIHVSVAALGGWAKAVGEAINAGENLIALWDQMNGKQMSLDEALLAAHRAVAAIKDAFEEGTKAVMGHSEAVVENRVVLEKAAAAAVVVAQAYLKAGGTQEGAQKIMDEFRIAAEKATGATGAQAREVHNLANELFRIPAEVNTVVTTTYIEHGSHPTYNPGSSSYASEEVDHRAGGGPIRAGVPYIFGEEGPEIGIFGSNGHMFSNADSGAIAGSWNSSAAAAALGGAGTSNRTITIVVKDTSGRTLRQELITDALNRNRPNDVVAAAYP